LLAHGGVGYGWAGSLAVNPGVGWVWAEPRLSSRGRPRCPPAALSPHRCRPCTRRSPSPNHLSLVAGRNGCFTAARNWPREDAPIPA